MIRQLIAVPPWINWLKSVLKSGSGGDDFGCEGLADRGEGGEHSFEMSFRERVIEVFEHPRYDLVQCSVTLGAAACLGGVLLLPTHGHRLGLLAIELQAAYLAAFVMEMSIMVYAYGQRFVRIEQYNLRDLLLVGLCGGLFFLQLLLRVVDRVLSEGVVGTTLATLFLCAMLARLAHLTQYAEELCEWVLDLVNQYMDSIIYTAYETGLALIKGEEDVRENIWKTVDEFMADQIRCHAGENRLEAAEEAMQQVMSAPYSFPSSYKPISVLRAVPWMGTDQLRQFLAMTIRPMSYEPGEGIIRENEDSFIVVATSGIVKVSGEVAENVDGALPNTASFLYFYSDGYFEDYILAPDIIGTLSIVSDEPCVTTVTAETAVNAYLIPKERLLEALEVFTAWPSFRYQLWYFICSTLSTPLLQSQPQYQTWPTEKVNNRLERMQMPDLMNAKQFHVSPDIEDLLLIQGRIMDATTEEEYLAPMYIPRTVTKIIFPGEVYSRPCPVMVIIANQQYTLPEEVDWVLREQRHGDENQQRAAAAGLFPYDDMTHLSRERTAGLLSTTDSALTCARCQQTGLRVLDDMDADRKRRLAAMAAALCEIDEDCYSFRRKWSCWQKDWVGRKELGVQNLLYKQLLKTDHEEYRRLLRVSKELFLQLLSRVETRVRKEYTVMRPSISAETRLQATLRYLASGRCRTIACFFAETFVHAKEARPV
ncbi:hypothetical protein HPB51_014390 [Rhipicephalus microplus]|uniref:Cyclic nucleotide-binding domain-containing protein n=1 Tax=Rhipicephalus microplus TaxID=6941 RepID=A0A9J6F355_RHIMP|nr:hypothetical protein HPB51_014390 [Rhipicephalus microplus]